MASIYSIKIWQENDDLLEQPYSKFPRELFCIKLKFHYVSSLNPEITLGTFNLSLTCPRDMFLSEECGPNIVLSMFANRAIDTSDFFQSDMIPAILHCAWEIDRDPTNLGRKVITLIIETTVEYGDTDNEVDQVIDDSLSTLDFKPASSSSIQALKRFKWGDEKNLSECFCSKEECTICLAGFLDSDEVALMPCGHVYHDGCIVKWLETSHLCPLCRYQMSS